MSTEHKILSFYEGVHCLEQGGVLIYPTETFFAVGCRVHHEVALEGLYGAKRRPKARPIPVLAADMQQVQTVAMLSEVEKRLVEQFWPGPLTLITKARDSVPNLVSAGSGKIALRISSHPLAMTLAKAVGDLLVCSSANISGEPPVSNVLDLSPRLMEQVDGIILGQPSPQGVHASTLVEVGQDNALYIRRKGAVSELALLERGWRIIE